MIMIKKIFILIFIISIKLLYSQNEVLDEYPKNQEFYEGGAVSFYKEIHEYLENNKFSECDAKEIYQPRIIVTKDAFVKLVQDGDTENIKNNKCAYDLAKEVVKNLKHWKPAEVKGRKIGALTEFIFYPKDVMSNYRENYKADTFITHAQYPDGNKVFSKDFHDNFMVLFEDYHINGDVNLEFYIDGNGHIVNPRIYPEIFDIKFNIDFLRTLSRLKKTWKPALYSNIPIKERIGMPLNFSITFIER